MNSFSGYMDKVKAEKELKEKTEAYVRSALSNAQRLKEVTDSGKKRIFTKKLFAYTAAVAACAVLFLGGNAYYHTPVNYVSFDINPSVELGVNAFGTVVSTQAFNDDGLQLLEADDYSNQSLEEVIGSLVQEAAEQGYIAEDGSTVIAVTAESNNEKTAAKLQNTCEESINLVLSAGDTPAVVYTDCVNLQLRIQAREAGISPGKFRLIQILQMLDSDVSLEQYRNAKITDIIMAAGEVLSKTNAWQNGEYAGILGRIQNAAQQAYGRTQQWQFQNQGSNSDGQVQNQNGDPYAQQTQGQGGSDGTQAQSDTGNQAGTDNGNNGQPEDTRSGSAGNGPFTGSQSGGGKKSS